MEKKTSSKKRNLDISQVTGGYIRQDNQTFSTDSSGEKKRLR